MWGRSKMFLSVIWLHTPRAATIWTCTRSLAGTGPSRGKGGVSCQNEISGEPSLPIPITWQLHHAPSDLHPQATHPHCHTSFGGQHSCYHRVHAVTSIFDGSLFVHVGRNVGPLENITSDGRPALRLAKSEFYWQASQLRLDCQSYISCHCDLIVIWCQILHHHI